MDEITKIALVGTSRHPGAVSAGDHPAGALLSNVTSDDKEDLLLIRSGLQAVYDLAGRRPIAGIDAVAPAPFETNRSPSRKLAGLLQNAIATKANDLVIEFLRQMHASQIVVPHDLLPELLDSKEADLRETLLPVLGERGRWLSRLNPDWSWVHSGVAHLTDAGQQELIRVWEGGAIRERCQVLATLRRADPRAAREWVAEVFAQEKPAHRVSLLKALEAGLSADDEPFLEATLADRSSAVVQAAASLLCRLPQSALAARMRERASAMLHAETKGILRKKTKLTCTPPEKIERDWERDGIPKQAPSKRGHRAFWAETILAAVPPSHWVESLGQEPAALIEAVLDDPFADAVLAGWTEAAIRFAGSEPKSAAWLMPLWEHWAGAAGRMTGSGREAALERLKGLAPSLSREQIEAGMLTLFEAAPTAEGVDLLGLLTMVPRPWSAKFSGKFLAIARNVLKKDSDNAAYQWANSLFVVARAIPAEVLSQALASWDLAEPSRSSTWHVDAVRREIEKFMETIQTRQSFLAELAR